MLDTAQIAALFQILVIDLVLAGDNAVIIALAAAGVRADQRTKVIIIGIIGATVLRAAFAFVAVELLQIVGLMLAGGILLLWVCWKLWREIQDARLHPATDGRPDVAAKAHRPKTLVQAALQIIAADVSMSLDNVLAVAGAARHHPWILVFGLVLSVGLMGVAANVIANTLKRYFWLVYVGLAIILYVALKMIWEGASEVANAVATP